MKVLVICEKCEKVVELIPQTNGQHAYLSPNLINSNFRVSDVIIDCSSSDDITDILDFDDIDVDKDLKEVRIDCQDCGDYITLTDF